jgi:hypothetical protein
VRNPWISLLRDLVSIAVGAFLAIDAAITGRYSPELLVLAALLLGEPGVRNLWSMRSSMSGESESSDSASQQAPRHLQQ